MKNSMLHIILTLVLTYAFISILIWLFQEKMLYFPLKTIDNSYTKTWNKIYERTNLLGYELIRNPNGRVLILFHGNGGNAQSRTYYASLVPANMNVFLAEYPGYGQNKDEKISMKSILEQSRKVMNHLIQTRRLIQNVDYKNEFVILGESLGTGVGSQMAKEFGINKLILLTPYDSILNAAQKKFPWLWCKPLLRNNFDNMENLKNYEGKVLFIIAEQDDVIPTILAKNLISSLPNLKKQEIVLQGARHNDWYSYVTPKDREDIVQFVEN